MAATTITDAFRQHYISASGGELGIADRLIYYVASLLVLALAGYLIYYFISFVIHARKDSYEAPAITDFSRKMIRRVVIAILVLWVTYSLIIQPAQQILKENAKYSVSEIIQHKMDCIQYGMDKFVGGTDYATAPVPSSLSSEQREKTIQMKQYLQSIHCL